MFHNDWFDYSCLNTAGDVYQRLRLSRQLATDILLIDAIDDAICKIRSNTSEIYLLYSGGADSHVILTRLKALLINFTAVIVRYDRPTDDVLSAISYVEDNHIPHIIIDYTPSFMLDLEYYEKKFNSPFSASEMMYLSIRPLFSKTAALIRGEGDPRVFRTRTNPALLAEFRKSTFHDLPTYLANVGIFNDAPLFYMYTKSLYQAYLEDTTVQQCLSNEGIYSLVNQKQKIFGKYGISFPVNKKMTGFENYNTQMSTLCNSGYLVPLHAV